MAKVEEKTRNKLRSLVNKELGALRHGDTIVRFTVSFDELDLGECEEPDVGDYHVKLFDDLKKRESVKKFLDNTQEWMHGYHAASQCLPPENEVCDSNNLLAALHCAEGEDLSALICEAELAEFEDEVQRDELRRVLWAFILANRDSELRHARIAVGSAIRKYIAMLDLALIGSIKELLEAGHRTSLSIDLELEVVKLVFAKFRANPPSVPDSEPELANQLAEMVKLYIHPRLLGRVQEGYAGVAILSLQSLAVMLSKQWEEILVLLEKTPKWFRCQLRGRLANVADYWEAKSVPAVKQLKDLVESISIL